MLILLVQKYYLQKINYIRHLMTCNEKASPKLAPIIIPIFILLTIIESVIL